MSESTWTRRQALTSLSGGGLALASCRDESPVETEMRITAEILQAAQQVAGLEFTLPEREQMLKRVNQSLEFFGNLREFSLDNSVPPAIQFDPIPRGSVPYPPAAQPATATTPIPEAPGRLEDLAYWPLSRLAPAVRARKVSSEELTRLYLDRLKKYDEKLECVISYTGELALEQARRADRELARGRYRGPLHGIPWGAKDLLAVRGYRTTWGATSHRDQTLDLDATVVRMLEEAGAVLIAKLSLGALAAVDVWYGGKTRNPWKLDEGSKGSSAGSAAATATGLVGFSIGSETMGSIVYPSATCGVTGLRPTFGRVSRHGAMTLSWSLDKLGPICRSAEDCALVFAAIHGLDPLDPTTRDRPFIWPVRNKLEDLRVGYAESLFQEQEEGAAKENDARSLEVFRSLGVDLVPVELPKRPLAPELILYTEAAAAFDEFTRNNQDDLLREQDANNWPNMFRQARFVPAVEYIQANRLRSLLMEDMARLMSEIDAYLAPSFSYNVRLTNLTGHPCLALPNGFDPEGRPTSISLTGRLFDESRILALGRAYQQVTDHHSRRPPRF